MWQAAHEWRAVSSIRPAWTSEHHKATTYNTRQNALENPPKTLKNNQKKKNKQNLRGKTDDDSEEIELLTVSDSQTPR